MLIRVNTMKLCRHQKYAKPPRPAEAVVCLSGVRSPARDDELEEKCHATLLQTTSTNLEQERPGTTRYDFRVIASRLR